jgi:hypothetical protein
LFRPLPGESGLRRQPALASRAVAKYAGQWNDYEHEPFSVVLQRRILMSWWWRRGLVTVYGEWPKQPKQVIPFFTSMMTADQVDQSKEAAAAKKLELPLQVVFSGRLVPLKAVDLVLRALANGWGLLIPSWAEIGTTQLGIGRIWHDDRVQFVGAIPFSEVMSWHSGSRSCLGIPSGSWPKRGDVRLGLREAATALPDVTRPRCDV